VEIRADRLDQTTMTHRLAIDPGPAACGWALEHHGKIETFGTRRFRNAARGRCEGWEAETADAFARWISFMLEEHQLTEIVCEQSFIGRPSPDIRWVGWACVSVALLCRRCKIDHRPISTGDLKKFATGSGRASSREMLEAARRRGYQVEDDHSADALFMLLMSQKGALPGPLGQLMGAA
jgi:Holliday junction resolvasome RuvABC endonuclease subunit